MFLWCCDLAAVSDGDSGAFLPPVLKSVEAEISHFGAILMAENPKDSALFLFIRGKRGQNLRVCGNYDFAIRH